jgi:hypothetical protein
MSSKAPDNFQPRRSCGTAGIGLPRARLAKEID